MISIALPKGRLGDTVYRKLAAIGYSCEGIKSRLDTVTNSFEDELDTYKPLIECIKSGVIRGAVAMVGCNNPKVRPDYAHIQIMKELLKNDIVIVASGCSAQAAAKAGLMDKAFKDFCGEGLKRVCELADKVIDRGVKMGEGWLLPGETAALIEKGYNSVVCAQPFGCLPNHIVGKGMIRRLKEDYPDSNIVAIDYDPGASEVNQLNRIKLMLSTARENLKL